MEKQEKNLLDITTVTKGESTMEPYIETFSGIKVWYDNVTPDMINIIDIAHSLSQMCRFMGHTRDFYSVAQHSVLVSDAQNTLAEKRAGLLHDATEPYLHDLPSPLKITVDLGRYKEMENIFHDVINTKYNINGGMTPNIKKADLRALFTEKRDVLNKSSDWGWGDDIKTFDEVIIPLGPKEAKELFLNRFHLLFPEFS